MHEQASRIVAPLFPILIEKLRALYGKIGKKERPAGSIGFSCRRVFSTVYPLVIKRVQGDQMIFSPARFFLASSGFVLVACGNPYTDYESGESTATPYVDGKWESVRRGRDLYFRPVKGFSPSDIASITVYVDVVGEGNEVWSVRVKDRFEYRLTEVSYGMTNADFIILKPARALKKGETYILVVHLYGFAPALRYRFVY